MWQAGKDHRAPHASEISSHPGKKKNTGVNTHREKKR
jgi:hypothetical protein